jgi:hypothetical protein
VTDTHANYLEDLGTLLRDQADEALREARSAGDHERPWFEGQLFAYMSILSLMQQQADAFGIPHADLHLDGLDPENDLLLKSDRATPKKASRWPIHLRFGRLHLILFGYRDST